MFCGPGGGLTKALKQAGLPVAQPMEAYPVVNGKRRYTPASDLELPDVVRQLEANIRSRQYAYIHFGLPRTTWAAAGRLNGGTRRKGASYGNGSLERELKGNAQLRLVVGLCRLCAKYGVHFSLENPADSYIFETDLLKDLSQRVQIYIALLDQCQFGLSFPEAPAHIYCRKRIRILASFPDILSLSKRCPGTSTTHQHQHAWRSIKVGGKTLERASLAGVYPPRLCSAWVRAISAGLLTPPKLISSRG